jgi:hypothetical protein
LALQGSYEAITRKWSQVRYFSLPVILTLAGPHLRPSTLHGYRDHVDRYLIPSLGPITLADLTGKRLQACFDLLARQRTRKGTLIAASTVDRVRATLRSALNAAVREGLIAANPLAQVHLAKPVQPHPVIWTDERVQAWPQRSAEPRRHAQYRNQRAAHRRLAQTSPPDCAGRAAATPARRHPSGSACENADSLALTSGL